MYYSLLVPVITVPVETGCKLKIHKTFRRRPERLLNILCTFNLHPDLQFLTQYCQLVQCWSIFLVNDLIRFLYPIIGEALVEEILR